MFSTAPVLASVQLTPARSSVENDSLILDHVDLVRRIAHHMVRCLPRSIEVDDLIQTGMVGLLEAAQRYECRNGASFATYATGRIRGAILDSLRRSDWGPRSLRRRLRDIDKARGRIEGETCGAARAPAIAAAAGVTLDDYFHTVLDFSQSIQVSLDEPLPFSSGMVHGDAADGKAGPAEEWEREEVSRQIAAAIAALPNHERVILLLYYDQEFLMREIGAAFAMSESRVCQIHKRMIERIRTAMQD